MQFDDLVDDRQTEPSTGLTGGRSVGKSREWVRKDGAVPPA